MIIQCFKRGYHVPASMKCLQLNGYGTSVNQLKVSFETSSPCEKDLKPDQALVKIVAASVNPIDIEMSHGYGRNVLNMLRQNSKVPEFPLILGRDCSGIIVKRGKRFRRFKEGDKIYCVRWVAGQGTHAQYVIVQKSEMSLQPSTINHVEAASLPFVACTTWNALINSGCVPITGRQRLRIFIPGGTGGIGSFALQLCQAYGHDVVTSCSADAIKTLNNLNISNVLDYKCNTFEDDLKDAGPFDVILDTLDEEYLQMFRSVMKQDASSKYVSLRPSILPETDKQGVTLGLINSGVKYIKSNATQLLSGQGLYQWGLFKPDGMILERIRPLVEDGKIRPLIDKIYSLDDNLDAYEHVEKGHARGKTVITMD